MAESKMPEKKKWILKLGTHNGSLASRDASSEKHDSLRACEEIVEKLEEDLSGSGHFIWFAEAVGPDGKEHKLHPGTSYRSY
ncbi:MAG: hypothetical protein Q8Q06_03735 [bacterium]|nr:hypothetical protein [bacterium]